MKSYTSIEQSKKLIELGIDVNTADMMWDDWSLIDEGWKLNIGYNPEVEKEYGRKCYPAWSLVALLQMLPHCIDDEYWLTLGPLTGNSGWYICYEDDFDQSFKYYIAKSNLIDACVELILKLHEQKLL